MNPIPSWDEIRRGETTDVYFVRTMEVLRKLGKDRVPVEAEVIVKNLPAGYRYGILAGIDDAVSLLAGRGVSLRAMPEGTLFHAWEPVASLSGPYGAFCEMETALLGLLCQASGVATKASRIRQAAGETKVLSFGARRMHPALSTVIDRNAYVGGVDGVSVVRSARYLGVEPQGTMPHALVLVAGDTVGALEAFDEAVDASVPRICLIDTLQDEKFEALRVAGALGRRLAGVRLDTPSSRRGDFRRIIEEVRWELDLRGHSHVRIMVSGGLSEDDVRALRDVVDGFGIGTCLANAPTIDFALDIVAVDGVPFAKRGKHAGAKQVLACPACGSRRVVPEPGAGTPCPCGRPAEPLLRPAMRDGAPLAAPETPHDVRRRVIAQVARFHAAAGEG